MVRVGLGVEGGDSNSCREEDWKWRAVVFVAIEPHPQKHDGNVFAFFNIYIKKADTSAPVI